MLIIDEPIFEFFTTCDTAPSIENPSIPHVSGIQIESGLYLDRILAHSNISLIESKEPKLNAILKNHFTARKRRYLSAFIPILHSSISLCESIECQNTPVYCIAFKLPFFDKVGNVVPSIFPTLGKYFRILLDKW